MKNYKAAQIQIIDQKCEQLQESISDLGCYYSLIKKEAKFIDVALFADTNNCVKISLSDHDSIVSMIIKNLTDKQVIGRLRLPVKEIVQYEQDYQGWYDFQSEANIQLKVQFKFILLQNDVASPSPMKSSLNDSQEYSLSSNSYRQQSQNSSEKKQPIHPHYITVGQEQDFPIITQFPASPTFKKVCDQCNQTEIENQDLFQLKIEKEQLILQLKTKEEELEKQKNSFLTSEQMLNQKLQEQNEKIALMEANLKEKSDIIDRLNLSIKKDQIYYSILIRVQQTQNQSYENIVGPINEYLEQFKQSILNR